MSKPPQGQCEGIGWGCNVYGGDAAFFAAIVVIPIALTLLFIGNILIAVVGSAMRRRSTVQNP
jgi:threonine/homoserine efflux transporter RhtA